MVSLEGKKRPQGLEVPNQGVPGSLLGLATAMGRETALSTSLPAHFLPLEMAAPEVLNASALIGWVGVVEPPCLALLEECADTPERLHRVLAAAAEALLLRYDALEQEEDRQLRFVDLLPAEGTVSRAAKRLAQGARYRFTIEAAASREDLSTHTESTADLTLVYLPGSAHCGWRFRAGAWNQCRLERFHAHYWGFLQKALQDPEALIASHSILTPREAELLGGPWNGQPFVSTTEPSIHALFEDVVRAFPGRVAVSDAWTQVTYDELNLAANRLAHYLLYFTVRPGSVVAILADPSVEMIVAMLAILKVGGVALALDPQESNEMLAARLSACGNPLVLCGAKEADRAAVFGLDLLNWSRQIKAIESQSRLNIGVEVRGDHAAFLVHSASPEPSSRGVVVLHRAVVALSRDQDFLEPRAKDVFAQVARPGLDSSLLEIWGALLNGAKVVIAPNDALNSPRRFADYLKKHKITTLCLPSGLLESWLDKIPSALAAVDRLFTGGDRLHPRAIRRYLAERGRGKLIHAYGAAECTGFAVLSILRDLDHLDRFLPLGRPRKGMAAHILDRAGNPTPVGVPGELHLEGSGLAWAYLDDPALTQERFIAASSGAQTHRLFATGDLARWTEDGQIEFIARRDEIVKFQGLRVDLGEIETALRRSDWIKDCVVVRKVAGNLTRLVAYVVLEKHVANLRRVMHEELSLILPEFLFPQDFITLDSLPLTPLGRIDRATLGAPALGPAVSGAVADAEAAESVLAAPIAPSPARGLWRRLWNKAQI